MLNTQEKTGDAYEAIQRIKAELKKGGLDAKTEAEKLKGLAEELTFESETTFKTKLQTIRENYFTTKKAQADVKSVVTDAPVDTLTEEKKLSPVMAAYTSVLNRNK